MPLPVSRRLLAPAMPEHSLQTEALETYRCFLPVESRLLPFCTCEITAKPEKLKQAYLDHVNEKHAKIKDKPDDRDSFKEVMSQPEWQNDMTSLAMDWVSKRYPVHRAHNSLHQNNFLQTSIDLLDTHLRLTKPMVGVTYLPPEALIGDDDPQTRYEFQQHTRRVPAMLIIQQRRAQLSGLQNEFPQLEQELARPDLPMHQRSRLTEQQQDNLFYQSLLLEEQKQRLEELAQATRAQTLTEHPLQPPNTYAMQYPARAHTFPGQPQPANYAGGRAVAYPLVVSHQHSSGPYAALPSLPAEHHAHMAGQTALQQSPLQMPISQNSRMLPPPIPSLRPPPHNASRVLPPPTPSQIPPLQHLGQLPHRHSPQSLAGAHSLLMLNPGPDPSVHVPQALPVRHRQVGQQEQYRPQQYHGQDQTGSHSGSGRQ